jgi:hypothetical protein
MTVLLSTMLAKAAGQVTTVLERKFQAYRFLFKQLQYILGLCYHPTDLLTAKPPAEVCQVV